jgi:hypothetical protein
MCRGEGGAKLAFKRDLPGADVRFPTPVTSLWKTHVAEIATAISEFLAH